MRFPLYRTSIILIFFLGVFFLSSCSKKIASTTSADKIVIYPPPPDTTRIQFLRSISSSSDLRGKRGGFKRFILGAEEVKSIGKPYGVAIHDGKIYICESFKRGLDVIDLNRNTFSEFIPTGMGALKVPLNCALDKKGYLYVADPERKQIVVFNEKGKYYASFGEPENFKPTDVFIGDGKIWVCNLAGHQVNVYSADSGYALLNKIPDTSYVGSARLFSPTNVFVKDSTIFVTDFGDFKVKKYTLSGILKDTVGTYGSGVGQFARPKGIAVDRESNLYVVDAGFENTQIFNKEGKLLMFFGGSYKGPGDMWLPAKVTIDYDNLDYFRKYLNPAFSLKYLILVTNQYGPDKLNIYGYVEPKIPSPSSEEEKGNK